MLHGSRELYRGTCVLAGAFEMCSDKEGDTRFRNTVMPPHALQKIRLAGVEVPARRIPTASLLTYCVQFPEMKPDTFRGTQARIEDQRRSRQGTQYLRL